MIRNLKNVISQVGLQP